MATVESAAGKLAGPAIPPVPKLCSGDHLSREEFERRYAAMPEVKKAELIEGVVYMPSPVSTDNHGTPHFRVITWLGVYHAATPGTQGADNSTLRLDWDNEPQPDVLLRILPEYGGQSRREEGYTAGAPELIVEVTASSAAYDLHEKLRAYQRNGVREYVVWRVEDEAIDWFVLRGGRFAPQPPDDGGRFRNEVFPGLWLDPAAMLRGDLAHVLEVLRQGIASAEHAAFVERLQAHPQPPPTNRDRGSGS